MQMEGHLAMAFGGRVAEVLIFGPENVTTGASSDIAQATGIARAMVTEYGMSEKLGRIRYRDNQQEVFLGHSVAQSQHMSDDTAQLIDEEVRRIIEEAEALATKELTDHMDDLHAVAKALLEYETLSGDEVKKVMAGEGLNRPDEDDETPDRGSSVPVTGKPTTPVEDSGGMEPQPT
jgi:cell division protease FtsH